MEAVDSRNQKTVVNRTVYLERSTNLVEAFAAPGPLLDFFGERLLYTSISDPSGQIRANVLDGWSGTTIFGPAVRAFFGPDEYFKPVQGWIRRARLCRRTPHPPFSGRGLSHFRGRM